MPQPNFVPVIFNSSRNTHNRGVDGSTSTVFSEPFTVSRYFAMSLSSFWTRCAGFYPSARGGDKFVMRERRRCAYCAVGPDAWLPRPQHQLGFRVMLQQCWSIHVLILLRIRHRATNSGTRQRLIVHVLPLH